MRTYLSCRPSESTASEATCKRLTSSISGRALKCQGSKTNSRGARSAACASSATGKPESGTRQPARSATSRTRGVERNVGAAEIFRRPAPASAEGSDLKMTSGIAAQRGAGETKPSYPERGIAEQDRAPPVDQSPQVAERQASAGARDGVKGKRNDLAARAPLHALVGRRRGKRP